MPAMHFAPVPCAPCDDCRQRATCAESGLICEAFAAYVDGVDGRSSSVWQQLPRIPRKRLTARARKADAALADDGAAEVRRIEQRAYMRAWRDRNRERVRAQGRERLRRLMALNPERLAQIRARVRAWAKAHPEAMRQSSRRWVERHRDEVLARSRRYYQTHREQSAAAGRAWRQAHGERFRALNRDWYKRHRAKSNARRRARYAEDPSRTLEAAAGALGTTSA